MSTCSMRFCILSLVILLAGITCLAGTAAPLTFPRLMGMNIGAKNYQEADYQRQLARLDAVILGFYKEWNPLHSAAPFREVTQQLKALNPLIHIGQYTILNESDVNPENDVSRKLTAENWWLGDASGNKVQWTADYHCWDVNFTDWTRPDAGGMRFPEWRALRDYHVYFQDTPDFRIWYLDNVWGKPSVGKADWKSIGRNQLNSDDDIISAHQAGQRAEWLKIRKLRPDILLMGNVNGDDLSIAAIKGQLDGAFLEAMMGKKWSVESWGGWAMMMDRYRKTIGALKDPSSGLVGFNVWGNTSDYRFFRYAYASCLMSNGYFSFTDAAAGYSSVPWFDEYGCKLGTAGNEPPVGPWQKGVWRRDFQYGIVLVNPATSAVTVTVESGFKRLKGTQDPAVNDGAPVANVISVPAKDGIILRRNDKSSIEGI